MDQIPEIVDQNPPPSFWRRIDWNRIFPVLFFIGGVIFDLITLDRIDSPFAIFSQLGYLSLATLLMLSFMEIWPTPEPSRWMVHKVWSARPLALHFCFGSLLSAYTIFYFKSASLVVSFGFLLIIFLLLLANELSQFRALGLKIKMSLLSLCWFSYATYMVPIALGSIGFWVFLLSLFVGLIPLSFLALILYWRRTTREVLVQVLGPVFAVFVLFLGLYLMRWIPPVPLSIQYMGVFHQVERQEDQYVLYHQRPWWRFWHRGDQRFYALPGDRVHVFFRLFSPSGFRGNVHMNWEFLGEDGVWHTTDRIPIQILGGREEGFRGFGFKSNYQMGRWRVRVLTPDQREIGRIGFRILRSPLYRDDDPESDTTIRRYWRTEVH